MTVKGLTEEEIRALPVSVPLVTAGRAFLIGRTKSHELARADEFPCRVIRVGRAYRVPTAALLAALGLDTGPTAVPSAAPSTPAGSPVATG